MAQANRAITPYDALTYQIIGCAMAVHRKPGSGYREDTYHRDLEAYLAEKNIPFEAQKLFYFGERSLVHRRILPPKSLQEHRVNRQWLFVPDWLRPVE